MNITDAMALSLGYAYGFRNSVTGPVREAIGVGVSMASQVQHAHVHPAVQVRRRLGEAASLPERL